MNIKQVMLPGVETMPEIRQGFVFLRYCPVKRNWSQVIDAFLKMNQWFDYSNHTLILIPLESGFIE